MSKTMTLPKIGVNMTEAIVDQWFVKPGDKIKEGDAIFLAETDKATQDIYATDSGIVGKLLAEEGQKVEIHEPIMTLLEEGEELMDKAIEDMETENLAEEVPKAPVQSKEPLTTKLLVSAPKPTEGRIFISPLAKKLAKERGIDIADLTPGTPGKRIVKKDVLAFEKTVSSVKTAIKSAQITFDKEDVLESIPMSNMRKVIANRMSESNLEKPCAALTLTARADEIIALRGRFKQRDIKVSYNDIFVRIVAQALSEHQNINSVLSGEEIQYLRQINIGVAVDSERGLLVPVIKDADKKSIQQTAEDFAAKLESIKNSSIATDDLTGGTFTITNLGMFGIEHFVPIINPPECCILAIGAMKKEFVPDDDMQPKLVATMKMTLVFDHRIVDGAPAAKFLQRIKQYVECPELLI